MELMFAGSIGFGRWDLQKRRSRLTVLLCINLFRNASLLSVIFMWVS